MKNKKVPLYLKVYTQLKEEIISEKYKEGELLPSENILENRFKVSKITIRRALQDLELSKYIIIKKGKGSIVLQRSTNLKLDIVNSFSQEAVMSGERASSIILAFNKIKASKNIAYSLGINEDDNIYYLKRLRLKNARIIGLNEQFICMKYGFKLDVDDLNEKTSIYNMYEKQGFIISEAIETIEAKMPTYDIKKELYLDNKTPIFKKTRLTYDTLDRILEFSQNYYKSDEYKYIIKLKK